MLLGCCIYKRPKRIISNFNSTLLRHPVHTGIIIFSHCYKPKVRQRNEYFASLTFVVGAACLPHLALMTVDYFFVFVLLLLCLVLYSVAFSLLRPPPLIHSVTGIRSIDWLSLHPSSSFVILFHLRGGQQSSVGRRRLSIRCCSKFLLVPASLPTQQQQQQHTICPSGLLLLQSYIYEFPLSSQALKHPTQNMLHRYKVKGKWGEWTNAVVRWAKNKNRVDGNDSKHS